MAKWGEGDMRWRVEDLGEQGRNVNNWHWEESNAIPWSKSRLEELLCGKLLIDEDNGTQITTAEDLKINGEATINQRKGKIIPAYEIDLVIKWKGTAPDGAEGTGEIKLPYISEENHDEDPEVQVSTHSGGAAAEKMRELIVSKGRPVIYKGIAEFVRELRAGGPCKPAAGGTPHVDGSGSAQPFTTIRPSVSGSDSQTAAMPPPTSTDAQKKSGGRSIEITESYFASAADIFECFTEPGRVRAYTGSPAEIEARSGGKFSMFGGSIEGTFRELQAPNLIDMDWRFSSWPDGAISRVVIQLEEKERGSVILKLKQTGIPDADRYGNHDVIGMTTAGWKQQVLLRMRQVFGFGA